MKIAHSVVITPGRCGLYETTRELVCCLREHNFDSRMVDPDKANNTLYPEGTEDRGAPFADIEWAKTADVIVSHSGIGGEFEKTTAPIISVAHGRPRHSFLSEVSGGLPLYSNHYNQNSKPRIKAVVTFWREHQKYLEVMYPDKPVYTVSSPVDLTRWSPGETEYDFAGHKGAINIICTDAWRDDIDPYVPINAYALWARTVKGAKLHVFGQSQTMKGWGALIKRIQDDGNMGIIQGWAKHLEPVYRAADLVITGHEIDVRTVREAKACGCPVLRIPGVSLDANFNEALSFDRAEIRAEAVRQYNPINTAIDFTRVLDAIH